MNKLAKIIETLTSNELALIQKDLQTGTLHRLIDQRLEEQTKGPKKTCPVCGAQTPKNHSIRLEFGPATLRQQAHFDATDCLQHFIEHTLKNKSTHQQST